jgi:hypothetical protein
MSYNPFLDDFPFSGHPEPGAVTGHERVHSTDTNSSLAHPLL